MPINWNIGNLVIDVAYEVKLTATYLCIAKPTLLPPSNKVSDNIGRIAWLD